MEGGREEGDTISGIKEDISESPTLCLLAYCTEPLCAASRVWSSGDMFPPLMMQ